MAGSVIDSLVVTLGLDSKQFAEGVKGSTEQLAGFTKRLAGMFLAVRGLEDVVGYFKDLHQQLAEVGFQSRNLGITGTEIKRLGEVSQLFGGQVSDAADSIQNLQSSVFNLRYKGQLSENLLMLQRFGIAYLDAAGNARQFRDIALDAAKVIDRRRAQGAQQGELTQLAQSFGFTGGIASAVAQGTAGFRDAFAKATKDQKPLTDRTIASQVQLDRDITRLQESTAAQSSVMLDRLTPSIEQATRWLQQLASDLLPKIVKAFDELKKFFQNPPPWLRALGDTVKELGAMLGPTGSLIAALGALTLAVGTGSALVSGIASLAGIMLPLAGAIAAGLGLGKLIDKIPGVEDKLESAWSKVFDLLGVGSEAGAAATAPATPGRAPPTPTAPRPGSAAEQSRAPGGKPTAMNGAGTQVHVDEINITTSASTLTGVGSDVGAGIQRKLLVSNADQGQG